MQESSLLIEEQEGAVAVLTLNRPDRRNALSLELIDQLRASVARCLEDDAVGAVVFTGTGPAFCAGMDLNIMTAAGTEGGQMHAAASALLDLYRLVYAAPKPMLAAVNGSAVAGGACLMTACDIAVAAKSAKIGYPEIQHGVVATIIMPFLLACVGERRARYLLLTGRLLSAADALDYGLVSECVADDACLPRTLQLGERLAGYPREAYAKTKNLLAEMQAVDPLASLEARRELHTRIMLGDDSPDTIEGFLSRRRPS